MIIGVDIGTQSLKVVVTDHSVGVMGTAARTYSSAKRREQHPCEWEKALAPAIGQALSQARVKSRDVEAIGIAGQLDGCVPVDVNGAAIGPCLTWMDRRATAFLPRLPESFHETTGLVADPTHMAAKIGWLKKHRPGAARFHQPVSYLVARLCGEHVFDHGLASTTMLYNLATRNYDPSLLAAFEIDPALLPQIAAATAVAGRLTRSGAALTGLAKGTIVSVGTGDDFATPLGAGMSQPGRVVVGVGTAEVVGALSPTIVIDKDQLDRTCLVETHPYVTQDVTQDGVTQDGVTQDFFVENPGWMAGGALSWLGQILSTDFAGIDALAAAAPTGADGLLFLPSLAGAMAPEWIPSARACFYGFTAGHTQAHMARAVMEGCAFAMRDVIDRLTQLGIATAEILMLGGGTRSAIWSQIRADVARLPLTVHPQVDTCPLGAAMTAVIALGQAPDIHTLASQMQAATPLLSKHRCEPDPVAASIYQDAYERYRTLFDVLRPLYQQPSINAG